MYQVLYPFIVGKEQIIVDRKVTLDELNSLITHKTNSRMLKNFILSIKMFRRFYWRSCYQTWSY